MEENLSQLQENQGQTEQTEPTVQQSEIEALHAQVDELRLKLALLIGGASPERLDEGMRLAESIKAAAADEGLTYDDAANEVLREYPHIRLSRRTIPRFSAEGTVREDGFAAIRGIFARGSH